MIGFIRQFRRRSSGDEGIALVVAISLVGIVGVLLLALVAVAMAETGATGRDRQRSQAVMAAEARLDTLIARIQAMPLAELPCNVQETESVSVVSDQLEVTATVTYLDSTEAELDCDDVRGGMVQPTQVLVEATAVSEAYAGERPAERTVEALLLLDPHYDNDLDKAIFGDAGVTLSNQADIYGTDGEPNADLYTNGDVACQNNQTFHGSIYAQGTVQMSNRCVVEVDVHARAGYTASNPQVSVYGNVLVSDGNIQLGSSQVGQYARVNYPRTVEGSICTSTPEKCVRAPAGTIPRPPSYDFPVINWNAATRAEWAANGYGTVVTIPTGEYVCGWWNGRKLVGPDGKSHNLNGKVDGAAAWIYENSYKLSGPTILVSTCTDMPVTFQGTGIELNQDLAIFAYDGVKFTNNSPIEATSSDQRSLYLIQPYDAVGTHPCYAEGITLDNQVTVAPNVDVLMYTPCNIRKANSTTHYGQIYAGGRVQIDNKLTMYYQPLPVFGVVTTGAVESYNVEILYKRENV